MKKILIILLLLIPFGIYAQTDRELLVEITKQQARQGEQITELIKQQAKQGEQVIELIKQQAVTTTKVDGLEKSVKERLDMQTNVMVGLMGFIGILIAAMIGFISYIFWDRQTSLKPIQATNTEMQKEINLLKEKELKHIERETKTENILKKLLEKHPDLANLA